MNALSRQSCGATHHVVCFTQDVADYFIGKPGPGSISEALHCGLPVIVAPSFANIDQTVDEVVANLQQLRENVARLDNQALYEAVKVLNEVLASPTQAAHERLQPCCFRRSPQVFLFTASGCPAKCTSRAQSSALR